jgi:PBP1b-binding outer membrane lipoprotein LpoB
LLKNFSSLAFLSILLSGCASPPKYDYVKQGASQYEKTNALSECNYQIKLNKTSAQEQGNLLNLCMQGKGYRYVQVN